MSNYTPSLIWPKEYSTSITNGLEQIKTVRITPNLYLRIVLGTDISDGIPNYIFWPDVLWYPNEDPVTVYLESYHAVESEIQAIEILENWVFDFLNTMKNIEINDQQERHTGSSIGGTDIREVSEGEVKREEEV